MTIDLQKQLFKKLGKNTKKLNRKIVFKAIEWTIKYHKNQLRDSGEFFYNHPVEVAAILVELGLDTAAIVTALLHDTIEDTKLTLEELEEQFGSEVSFLVNGVTKLTHAESKSLELSQAENFRKLLLALTDDIRILLVKLADRLHNMRTIKFKKPESRKRIALETLEIYAPLAERMGINSIKLELQDLAFEVLYPEVRSSILQNLEITAYNNEALIDEIVSEISTMLKKMNIPGEVHGRKKTPYSIWMKMIQKNINFEQLSDIIAFRIIVPTVGHCYKALGLIHSVYRMIPEMFQDFISNPKSNGYQSLHTIVIGLKDKKIEVQIRTQYMHNIAEYGIASHWRYKQVYDVKNTKDSYGVQTLNQIINQDADLSENIRNTKLSMYYDQVFCFTPKGQVIALPKGATILDFAFALPRDLGLHCIGGKVNSHASSVKTELKNGDQVEILLSGKPNILPSWEQYVVTGKARSEIRNYIKNQQKRQYTALGEVMLKNLAKVLGIKDFASLCLHILDQTDINGVEELFEILGSKKLDIRHISEIIDGKYNLEIPKLETSNDRKLEFIENNSLNNKLPIQGIPNNMKIDFAGCCYPLPSEDITGILHYGRGMMIHRTKCSVAARFFKLPELVVKLTWQSKLPEQKYISRIFVIINNTSNSLELFLNSLAMLKTKVINIKFAAQDNNFIEMFCDIEVSNVNDIEVMSGYLRSKNNISLVRRHSK
jgi:GTP pyrophosphokinase